MLTRGRVSAVVSHLALQRTPQGGCRGRQNNPEMGATAGETQDGEARLAATGQNPALRACANAIGELNLPNRLMLTAGTSLGSGFASGRCSGNRRIVAEVGGRRKSGSFLQGLKPI